MIGDAQGNPDSRQFLELRCQSAVIYSRRKKQAKDGSWKLQRTYNERSKHDTFKVVVPLEERLAPSKWVTLRALTVLKRWMG